MAYKLFIIIYFDIFSLQLDIYQSDPYQYNSVFEVCKLFPFITIMTK